jgi:predicted GIY-YIG superfamily endonuclease
VEPAVRVYLDGISSPKRRRDAETMVELMRRATGQEPRMWGSIVGFGEYHYKYESGREGDSAAAGFAARKAATTVYAVDGIGAHTDLLERLGPHTTGVGCIYIKDLTKVDLAVLEAIISQSYTALTAGTYTKRAREGGKD